jgi:NAD(P)H dehydrogenase (quinone)
MRVQVIRAHPLRESFNEALFTTVISALQASGHEVRSTDLYGEDFDPRLSAAECSHYHDGAYDASAVQAYVDALRWAEGLVFCFPQWWFGFPAILKGYFDRVWVPGIAFRHDPARGRIRAGLTHISFLAAITTYGAPWWFTRFYAGDPCRKMFMRALRPICGGSVRCLYLALYDFDRSTPRDRARFLARVSRRMRRL